MTPRLFVLIVVFDLVFHVPAYLFWWRTGRRNAQRECRAKLEAILEGER